MESTELEDYGSHLDESKSIEENYAQLFKKPKWDSIQDELPEIHRATKKLRTLRDKQNAQTKKFIQKRNELNEVSKSLKEKVKQLTELRNLENNEVKQLKKARAGLDMRINEAKILLEEDSSLKETLSGLQQEQTEIHTQVQEQAKDAQLSHENVVETKMQWEKSQAKSQKLHASNKKSKKRADTIHTIFIQFMNRQNELKEHLNNQRGE